MEIRLKDIPKEGLELCYEDDPVRMNLYDREVDFSGEVRVLLRMSKEGSHVRILGEVNCLPILRCSRCLREFPFPIRTDFYTECSPLSSMPREEEYELTRGELDTDFYRGEVIEVDDLVREEVILHIPMRPLCRPECRGLCPRCGEDLNLNQCNCLIEGA